MGSPPNGTLLPKSHRIAHILIAAALLLTGCTSTQIDKISAKATPSKGPAIWRLADSDTEIFLFGIAEIIPPQTQWRSESFITSFAMADQVILETDESPAAQASLGPVIQQVGLFQDGRKLRDVLNDTQEEKVAKAFEAYGVPLEALDQLKPWLAAVQLGSLNAVRQGHDKWTNGLVALAQEAAAANKPIRYLEPSRAAILTVIAELPEEAHINMLVHAANQVATKPDQPASIMPVWLTGDVDMLGQQFHGDGQWADQRLYDALLIERNRAWVTMINDMLAHETGTVWIGLGTGHLVGPDSLINMLNDNGLKTNRQ